MNLAGPSIAAFLALPYFTTGRDRTRAARTEEHRLLEAEQARSEQLLLNILSAAIADRLRGGATSIAESQPDVSVLFADIVGFTPLGDELGAHALVDLLNEVFVVLDDLAEAAGRRGFVAPAFQLRRSGTAPEGQTNHRWCSPIDCMFRKHTTLETFT